MEQLLSAEEAGKELDLSRPSVLKLVRIGELKPAAMLDGYKPLFRLRDLEQAKPNISIKPRNGRKKAAK